MQTIKNRWAYEARLIDRTFPSEYVHKTFLFQSIFSYLENLRKFFITVNIIAHLDLQWSHYSVQNLSSNGFSSLKWTLDFAHAQHACSASLDICANNSHFRGSLLRCRICSALADKNAFGPNSKWFISKSISIVSRGSFI